MLINIVLLLLSAAQTPASLTDQAEAEGSSIRIDFYLSHFEPTVPLLPALVRYALVDGFYAKEKLVRGVCQSRDAVVSRLRIGADLRFLYHGEPAAARGRPRNSAGKVNLSDFSLFEQSDSDEKQFLLYTERLRSVSLKREIRVPVLVSRQKTAKQRTIVLFPTNLQLDAKEILRLYSSRFQIEFLFRDAIAISRIAIASGAR